MDSRLPVLPVSLLLCLALSGCMLSNAGPPAEDHEGYAHPKLVQQGEKTGLGAKGYMETLEVNCRDKKIKVHHALPQASFDRFLVFRSSGVAAGSM
eukprot:SAG11_NODE_96_length_17016_cov_18.755113_6_plen_96_part_00